VINLPASFTLPTNVILRRDGDEEGVVDDDDEEEEEDGDDEDAENGDGRTGTDVPVFAAETDPLLLEAPPFSLCVCSNCGVARAMFPIHSLSLAITICTTFCLLRNVRKFAC
tara:strand:+ start:192 stop:527 length:336 start_codon:yes stop_codon:yes gene_type:complete